MIAIFSMRPASHPACDHRIRAVRAVNLRKTGPRHNLRRAIVAPPWRQIMTRIAVLDDWQGIAADAADWSALRSQADLTFYRDAFADPDAIVAALAEYDIVLAMRERTALPKSVIDRLPRLRLLSFTGARNAAVDIAACAARGITVCNTTGGAYSHATAELALGLMLAAARDLPHGDAELRAGRFQQNTRPGLELHGATLGLIGLGKIGADMARYGTALGMKILAWSPNLTPEHAAAHGATRVEKRALLSLADAVSLHLVLSDRSRGTLGAADLAAMKSGAILVNTSRAGLVDAAALKEAVLSGHIVAALDVYDEEPLPPDHWLRSAKNTVLTPHLGYVARDNMAEFYRLSIENIIAWLAGQPIRVVSS
jgi:phosphoglycerate dehydrogenase-like enzyme